MISDIRANGGTVNLVNCGKFTLAEDLSDISDITSIDLSDISTLTGNIQVLEKCPNLTSVDFSGCWRIEGEHTSNEIF